MHRMLELRPNCECCDCDLPNGSPKARICIYECTFCDDCAEHHFNGSCPNCGGNFTLRPSRPAGKLVKHPAATKRIVGSHEGCGDRARRRFEDVERNEQRPVSARKRSKLFMIFPALLTVAGLSLAGVAAGAEGSPSTLRFGPPEKPISVSASPPAGARLVYISGTVADPVDSNAPIGSVERYGDTEAQTRSVLDKIEAALAQHGMHRSDIVMMRVFLVAPPGQQRMDFAAMMRVYLERFGTPDQPNKPARSALQVAGLADPGWLVEIEVTAAKGGSR
jgi:enamine deaminase RidA (YjgF/YER057c/UK114 family)